MKKWVGLFISLFLILLMGISSVSGSFYTLERTTPKLTRLEEYRIIFTQDEVEKEKTDPHMVQILIEIQRKLDGWLKSLNERIEREDVTRFEVRFLEILRNILEWVKEKIDVKIESIEREKPLKERQKGLSQETHQKILPLSIMG